MENKQKIKIYIGLLITIILIIGVSYAYFRIYKSQTNDNVIGTRTCLDTTLTENSSEIVLTEAVPISDERGVTKDPFTFTLTNNCNEYVEFQIALFSNYQDSTDTQYLKDDYVKVNLSKSGTINSGSYILSSYNLNQIDTDRQGYLLKIEGLKANESKTFDLRLWLDSETTAEQGLSKTWKGKIIVTFTAAKEQPTWDEPGTGTLLAAIKRDNTVSEPLTTPGLELSASNEAVLASTDDDYGTSYYFRGAVTNNFVEYANMCWRIVRITGNGAIKLILYNYNDLLGNTEPKSDTPCNVTGNGLAFAQFADIYFSGYGINYLDNAYAGMMYGATNAKSYADTHTNINPNTILENINRWYNQVLLSQKKFDKNHLADTIWCNDKSVITDSTYNPWNLTLGTNYGYGKNANYYGIYKRIISRTNSAGGTGPTLRCPNDNLGGKLSKLTVNDTIYGNGALKDYNKIGLLTVDEVAFAGGAAISSQTATYYLNENARGNRPWYTSTPGLMNNSSQMAIFAVSEKDNFNKVYTARAAAYMRPSISLVPTIKISTGTGTATDPYKIS